MEEINKVKYTDEDILLIAEKMHDSYKMIFLGKKVPIPAISSLAILLEEYPQTEDKKLIALEYAARIKYEIQNMDRLLRYKLEYDKRNFVYNKSSFAVKKAISDIYGYGEINDIPEVIESCVDDAYFYIISSEYEKGLSLNIN